MSIAGHTDEMRPTVLVVRASELQRRGTATVLRLHGFHVIEASTGPEALERAAGARVDVLVAELLMPGMNGLELARRLRAHRPGLAALITSEWELSQRQLDLAGGADARLLPRAGSMQGLVEAVRKASERSARHHPSEPPTFATAPPLGSVN